MRTITTTPALIRIKEKGQLTLPAKLRARHGLRVGDYVEVREEKGHIALISQEVTPRDPALDAMIVEGLADIRRGRFVPFKDGPSFRKFLKSKEGKQFLKTA
jgi:AbrB family looped-hinge helix DNA binding protein